MIKLQGATKREFHFPAEPGIAIRFFSDFQRIAIFLPHITVATVYTPNALRMHYRSVEMGAYTINLFADVQSVIDSENGIIHILPLKGKTPVPSEATLNTSSCYGDFASKAIFMDAGDESFIEYHLKLGAQLPRPRGLRMMPGRVVNRIAKSISEGRVREIADGFMVNALAAFPHWLAEQQANQQVQT
ncbi:MAG: hypothetical protein KDE48_00845 [Anaerolineales bacterium]|nr:hypothetical protein [Anaerolineales bacterium]